MPTNLLSFIICLPICYMYMEIAHLVFIITVFLRTIRHNVKEYSRNLNSVNYYGVRKQAPTGMDLYF